MIPWILGKKSYTIKEEIISAFKKGIFSYKNGFQVDEETGEETL